MYIYTYILAPDICPLTAQQNAIESKINFFQNLINRFL